MRGVPKAMAVLRHAKARSADRAGRLRARLTPQELGELPAVRATDGSRTAVDAYWAEHTVNAADYPSRRQSERQLEWRFDEYPLFREFSGLWGRHDAEVVLDYGCGPGNDLTGFALHTEARRIVGVDVSERALGLAARRLALHRIDPARIELIRISDSSSSLPLEDSSVDYLQSQGVLHHVSDPESILRDLYRVLRPGGRGCVMVYNRDSIWLHLYTAYERMLLQGQFAGLTVEEAFARNTDGEDCPISRCYRSADWMVLCEKAGFEVEFLGGYLSRHELSSLQASWARAIVDDRLAAEHRGFLRTLTLDPHGFPMHKGFHAGIGGTYRLRRPL
jgi:ubiquinone/menaquinone biosynthesis C-methylase UbiE